jgi:hypothetical protein
MTRFPTAGHLVSWAKFAPGVKVNRPGIDGGSDPWRGWSHVSPEEVSPRAS